MVAVRMNVPRDEEHEHRAGTSSAEVTFIDEVMAGRGRRYEVTGLDGVRVVVVVHRTGEREVTLLTEDDDEPVLTLSFTDAQACTLASVLADAFDGRNEPGWG